MVVAIILTIAAIAIPNLLRAIESARVARAVGDITAMERDFLAFQVVNGHLPHTNTFSDIGRDGILDPWGSPYVFVNYLDPGTKSMIRKDHFLKPMNSEYDLYSIGPDHKSAPPINAGPSHDDVLRADDGSFVGVAANY